MGDASSLVTWPMKTQIAGLVTSVQGAFRAPAGGTKGYAKSLFDFTPKPSSKPELVGFILSVYNDKTAYAVVVRFNGEDTVKPVNPPFGLSYGMLTPKNALATGATIAEMLGLRGAEQLRCKQGLKSFADAILKIDEGSRVERPEGSITILVNARGRLEVKEGTQGK